MHKSISILFLGGFFLAFAGCSAPQPPAQPIRHTPTAASTSSPTPIPVPTSTLAPTLEPTKPPFTHAGEISAPEFPPEMEWLNVDRPLSLAQDLRGKIVLLDFWTLGCINCIHVMPYLKRLEAEFPDSLVVIGIHSAKFETEGEAESIRQAILRYGLEHPVINDRQFQVWNLYGARAWPTLFLIDPLGKIVGFHAGEGIYPLLRSIIATMDKEYREAGLVDERPLELVLESQKSVPTVLSFPGKVLADEAGNRLFIADSNHNRILIANLEGELLSVIGTGAVGREDGGFASATFDRPQGMALAPDGNTLYIADLENHLIRAADLVNQTITTIAGTGNQGRAYPDGRDARQTSLSSPWDLLLNEDTLYIATAGLHQIWTLDLNTRQINVFAGSGLEGIDDGSPLTASLAQPSGFTTDGTTLFFTDPESSAIRQVALDGSGNLNTIIGTGLFDFGDVDGVYPEALLQHALGIAYDASTRRLFVADSYNHKIKIIDPVEKSVQTWIGSGQMGWQDGLGTDAKLAEPSGLSIANGKLYIADTNNHLIRVADLETGEISTLVLSNLGLAMNLPNTTMGTLVDSLGTQTVGPGEGNLESLFTVPEGYQFNDLGPFTLSWDGEDGRVVTYSGDGLPEYKKVGPEFPLSFPVTLAAGETNIHVEATAFYCRVDEAELCLVQEVALDLPIIVNAGSVGSDVLLTYELPPLTE